MQVEENEKMKHEAHTIRKYLCCFLLAFVVLKIRGGHTRQELYQLSYIPDLCFSNGTDIPPLGWGQGGDQYST